MSRRLALLALFALAACAAPPVAERRATPELALPPMKTFGAVSALPPDRSNASIARDFLDLSFRLESGRALPVLTRFEGPVTVRLRGRPPASTSDDLDRLLARLRNEAGIEITRTAADAEAAITVETVARRKLLRAVPRAACFVVPRVSSWQEFRGSRGGGTLDWTTLSQRRRMAIFVPRDVSPQEARDCLHEELAQALGPLNDLYRLSDSVFNDDNFHTVLTGFDMLVLRATYARELHSGMTRAQVARRLPGILARLNPAGRRGAEDRRPATSRDWIDAIETALGPHASDARRRAAAKHAVTVARARGWDDNRLGFSLFALGRLSTTAEPELALASFLQAAAVYGSHPDTRLHAAHVAMQLAAFTLSAGQPEAALAIVDESLPAVRQAQNAALLATLMLVKAEALAVAGRAGEARAVRRESLAWARYGFGTEDEVRRRAGEIAALTPRIVPREPA